MPQIENDCQFRIVRGQKPPTVREGALLLRPTPLSTLPSRSGFCLTLFRRPVEEGVNRVEQNHSGSDHRAGCHGSPKDIPLGKFPDCQQAGHNRDYDASACRPERDSPDHRGIQEASLSFALLRVLQVIHLELSHWNDYQVGAHRTQLGHGRKPQRQVSRIVADPHMQLHPIALRIVGRKL